MLSFSSSVLGLWAFSVTPMCKVHFIEHLKQPCSNQSKVIIWGVADLNVGKTAPSAGKGQVGEYLSAKHWRIWRPFKSWAEGVCPCSNNSHYEMVIVLFWWKWGIIVQWQEHTEWRYVSGLGLAFIFFFLIYVILRKSLLSNNCSSK